MPVAAHAEVVEGSNGSDIEGKVESGVDCYLKLTAGVWSIDGKKALKKSTQLKFDHSSLLTSKTEAFMYVYHFNFIILYYCSKIINTYLFRHINEYQVIAKKFP